MRISNAQNMAESDFGEKFFPGQKCRKYAGKTGFLEFLEISSFIFPDFLHKDAY